MLFRHKRHPQSSSRSEATWNPWLPTVRGQTVELLIYQYGQAVVTNKHLEAFKKACVRPSSTDRSGAAAESVLRDIVEKLQAQWGQTFRGEAIVWRMWATHVTKNLDRTTWDAAVSDPPSVAVASLLRPAASSAESHSVTMNRASMLALNCVNASIAEVDDLWAFLQGVVQRVSNIKSSLAGRKETIEGFVQNVLPVPLSEVQDPSSTMENVPDVEHEE